MPKVILQLQLDPKNASLEHVQRGLQLKPGQIDTSFGVRPVPKRENLFAIKIDADVAGRVREQGRVRRSGRLPDTRVALIN